MNSKIINYLIIFFFFLITFSNCSTFPEIENSKYSKTTEYPYRICFWNVKNLSKNGLERESKGSFIIDFSKSCDVISFLEIRSEHIDMAKEFEEKLSSTFQKYYCMEGKSKPENGKRKEKYVSCVKSNLSSDLELFEYEDNENNFARAPTFFILNLNEHKILLIPFHSTPSDKNELIRFQDIVDYSYKFFSDRRIFYGGDFNTGTNYQSEEFLSTLPYFSILVQLIKEPSTFGKQKHDLIFTDPRTAKNCKGKVWDLNVLFPEIGSRKALEKISDHYPISAECEFK
jgi:hypothetical protein